MKVKKYDGSEEKQILTGMIVNQTVLTSISARWEKGGLFASKWCNLIGFWCVDYFRKFKKAPEKHIQRRYESWRERRNGDSQEIAQPIGDLLEFLSDEYEQLVTEINPDFIIDLAGKHFNRVRLKQLGEKILAHLENDDGEKAVIDVAKFHKLEMGVGAATEIITDMDEIREAFRERSESLINYPGALGQFFGDSLEREGFIAFEGPEKSGKSFLLMDLAYRALLQKKRVAFFEVGDMSKRQTTKRFLSRIARHPVRAQDFEYPLSIEKKGKECIVVSETRKFTKPLDWRTSWKACQKLCQRKLKSKESLIKFSFHPSSSINVEGLNGVLEGWEHHGWIPDVIVVDYADILAPPIGIRETLDQVDQTWSQLRALSQTRHCLLVTATQATREAYTAKTMRKEHTAQNKRKNAHVTGKIGINMDSKDRKQGIIRLNWLFRRDEKCNENECIHLAGALAIANPAIKSTF